jgi:hypothetical protein
MTSRFEAYKITNLVNGKLYFGITTIGVSERWKRHLLDAKTRPTNAIRQALRKYGPESFSIERVGGADNWDALCELERTLIAEANSLVPHGYNMTSGGEGTLNPSEEVRAAIGRHSRIHMNTPEARAANSARAKLQTASPEWRAAHAERMRIFMSRPEVRLANAARGTAQFASPEARAVQAEVTRAYYASPERRAEQAARLRAFHSTRAARGKADQQEAQSALDDFADYGAFDQPKLEELEE